MGIDNHLTKLNHIKYFIVYKYYFIKKPKKIAIQIFLHYSI